MNAVETLEVPWGRIPAQDFARDFAARIWSGGPAEVTVLCRNSTETRWFQTLAVLATAACFITGREPKTGQRFGQLVVTDPETRIYTPSSPPEDRAATCRCDCGNEVTVRLSKLAGRNPPKATRSCGRHDPHQPGRRTTG
jgi:hypothetical protein